MTRPTDVWNEMLHLDVCSCGCFLQRKKNLFNIYVSFYRIAYVSTHNSLKCRIMLNMAVRVVKFSSGGIKLERFFHYFWCQNWDLWHKMSGKNIHIIFFTLSSKINEFERKKSEKNEKIPKTWKLQAITLTSNSH